MSLLEIMKKNNIDPNWIFTHARLHNKEGLFFFESVVTDDDEGEQEQYFDAKCLLIDNTKLVYGDDMEKEIEINSLDDNIIFNRVDGVSVSIPSSGFDNFPFKVIEFGTSIPKTGKPKDYVEID